MNARTIDPTTDQIWAELVTKNDSDVFHSPGWMRVLERTYGFEPRAVVVEHDGQVVAGLPYCEIRDIRGHRLVSLPFSDSCDPIVSGQEEWAEIVTALQTFDGPLTMRVLHNGVPLEDPRFVTVGQAGWHGLVLDSDVEAVWSGIDASARRAVRKARREGLEARPATDKDELRQFFDLHLRTRKGKYGLLAQPYAFFENIWDEFIDDGHGVLMLTYLDDSIIGGILFLEWQGAMHYKFNASSAEHINLRPNDLALWTAIESGCANGSTSIDFGLSDLDQEGLLRYKRKYATEEKTITMLRYQPEEHDSSDGENAGRLLSSITRLLTDERVPDEITEKAGDEMYRYFA